MLQSTLADYLLMVVFAGVFVSVAVGWYLLGRNTYGTGDYFQP